MIAFVTISFYLAVSFLSTLYRGMKYPLKATEIEKARYEVDTILIFFIWPFVLLAILFEKTSEKTLKLGIYLQKRGK